MTGRGEAGGRLARLASFPELNPNPVLETGPDGTLTYLNPAAERLFPDLLPRGSGHPLLAALPPAGGLGEGGVVREVEVGGVRYQQAIHRVPGEGGLRLYVVDVSGRARAVEALRQSEERFRGAFESASIGMALVGLDARYLRVNRALCGMLGYPEEELVGRSARGLTHPGDDLAAEEAHRQRVLRGETDAETLEKRYVRKDGSAMRALLSVSLVRDADGAPGHFVAQAQDITGRKEAEEALRRSEAALADAQRIARLGSWEFDLASGGLWWSDELYRIYGFEPQKFEPTIGTHLERVHPDDRERVRAANEAAARGGGPAEVECRVVRPGGETRVVRNLYEVRLGEGGEPVGLAGTVQDVTGRREAERALAEAEERYRTLVENVPAVVYVDALEGPGYGGYTSPRAEAMLGYPMEAWNSDPHFWTKIVHPDDKERVVAENERANAEASPLVLEYRMIARNGSAVWVRDESTVLRGGGGEPRRRQGILLDITGRKEAERRLGEAEARYRTLVEQIPAVTYVDRYVDPAAGRDDEPVYVSPQVEEMLGYAPEEWIGRGLWPRRLHPDDRGRVLAADARFEGGEDERFVEEYRLLAKDGSVVWVREEAAAVKGEGGEPLFWQGVILDVTERKALERRLEHRALHDPLTGLPNRDLFSDRLGQALARAGRAQGAVSVLFVDLDNFKYVNDSLGHEAGDRLLAAVAGRLRTVLRPGDTAARLGGDEFAALLEEVSDEDEASRVAERIVGAMRAPFPLDGGREVFVTSSVGVVLGHPARGDSPGDLLRRADVAMYRAKERGKARYAAFDPAMEAEARARLELENGLRRALERGEFRVRYQPVVRIPGGEVVGFEALLRWEHPERGLLAPDAFLGLAEELGLTVPIGRLVLRDACLRTRRWQEGRPGSAPLAVGVNLSARQLSDPGLPGDLEAARREAGLLPEQVTLEVTEDAAVGDSGARLDALRELRDAGFLLALDNFGTGQFSLSSLKQLSARLLKIDRSFVEGLGGAGAEAGAEAGAAENEVLLSGVVGIAHGLGMGVLAEGVETPGQLARVEALGCDLAQGLLFSGPVPGEEAGALLGGRAPLTRARFP